LDRHRQRSGQVRERGRLEQLPAQWPDRQVDADALAELRRRRAAGDHEHVALELLGRLLLPHRDAELARAPPEPVRERDRAPAAVENCWRTPPIPFAVARPAIVARSASTTSSAPRSARWYATDAPTAPIPATTIRAIAEAPPPRRR